MNKYRILSTLALFFTLTFLGGCRSEIYYVGTTCAIPDSSRVAYNTELAEAYKFIDSTNLDMLKGRGPKMSRHENEDIDDEYDGALKIANEAKEHQQEVLSAKYCVTVDEYSVGNTEIRYPVNDFQIKPADTAIFHEAKRNFLYQK